MTTREALALKALGGSPAKGLRRLIDQQIAVPGRANPSPAPASGACRIHKRWSEPEISLERGHRTITKTCLDCGHVSTSTRPA